MGKLEFGLDGKVVVVIGASRGIGASSAVACARAGAERVVLVGRDREALALIARRVKDAGADSEIAICDVTSVESISSAFESLDRVDVLVGSAGGNRPEAFVDVDPETFDSLFALNVRGVFFCAQEAARRMIAAGKGGVIILISSQMGHVGAPMRSIYCATKHAVEGLTKALAVELAPAAIRVVAIAPTFVRTAMTAAQLDDPRIGQHLLSQIPMGRFETPEEVGTAVVYAASPAAAMMTGTSVVIDGGWTAQ